MIGIFWIINDFLVAKRVELSQIEEVNGFKDSGLSHFFEWDKIGFDTDIYDKFPRGRVVYDIYNQKFIIYTAKQIIKNSEYQQMILDFFKINKNYSFE